MMEDEGKKSRSGRIMRWEGGKVERRKGEKEEVEWNLV